MRLPVALLLVTVSAGLLLAVTAPLVLVVLALDGLAPLAVLVAAGGIGGVVRPALRCTLAGGGRTLLVETALGALAISLLTLALGWAGWLNAVVAWVLVGGGCGLAGLRWRREARDAAAQLERLELAALLAAAPALAMLLFAATLPPGVLWLAEGRGYDVLEYHLQAPREYHAGGAIEFLPHNVYAAFPQQVESQYLLLMHLLGGPWAAAIPAQLLHAGYALLAVAALAAFAPRGRPRAAVLALGATTPWFVYVGALAYVEAALLFFAAAAGGLVLAARGDDGAATPPRAGGYWLVAGLLAGAAAGCKYTALARVAAPLLLLAGWTARGSWRTRGRCVLAALGGVALAFGPWAVRNAVQAGNPVYPFAYELFGGAAWSEAQAEQWRAGHAGRFDGVGARLNAGLRELVAGVTDDGSWTPALFGVGLFPLVLVALVLRPKRARLPALAWLAVILAAWFALTHMPGRFAVVALAPAGWLVGAAAEPRDRRAALLLAGVFAAAIVNLAQSVNLLRSESAQTARHTDVRLADFVGQTEAMRALHPLNQLPPGARLKLVGPAAVFYVDRPLDYTVVFNRDPWLPLAERAPAEAVAALRARGVTHLVFDWLEIARLARTYGFPEFVRPEWAAEFAAGLERVRLEGAPEGLWVFRVGE